MGKLHRTNAGYLGVSMEETQDPFWSYNKLALPLDASFNANDYVSQITGNVRALSDTYGPFNAFDGNTATINYSTYGSGSLQTWTPASPITGITTLEVFVDISGSDGTGRLLVNGTNRRSGLTHNTWNTITGVSTLTTLAWGYSASTANEAIGVNAIRINGQILIQQKDLAPSPKFYTSVGATWQTSVSKFYGGATLYDGNADYQQTPYNADFNFGSGDFTIESFIRLSALGTSKIIANYIAPTATTGNDLGWIFDVNSSNQLEGVLYSGTSAVGLIQAGSLTTGTWYHVAYVRSGSTFLLFLDGSQIGSATGTAAHNVNTGWNVSIGYGHTSGTQYMNGYIQDLRIYKGIAKYTSSFTPPARSLVQTARRYPSGMHVLS